MLVSRPELVEWGLRQGDDPGLPAGDAPPLDERFRAYHRFRRLLAFDPPPPSPHPPVEPVNGRYCGLKLIGEGGYGEVYRATDSTLGRTVALKFLRGELGPAARTGFFREAHILAGLHHPNILTIHDADTDTGSGRAFLALTWMAQGSLSDHMAEFRGRPDRVAKLMERVARGLHYAHTQGVVHRDLKPANILLGDRDEVCVADFGIAKLILAGGLGGGDPATRADASGTLGTLAYMAPEQSDTALGLVGPASDVWAVGVILHELLTGRRPVVGDGPPTGPRVLDRRVPRSLDAVCQRCLALRPEERWPTAGAVADALLTIHSGGVDAGDRSSVSAHYRRLWLPTALAALAIGLGVTLVVMLGRGELNGRDGTLESGPDPTAALLKSTGQATLIGQVGPPAIYKPLTAANVRPVADHPKDKPFGLTFDQWTGLVELLEENPCPAFELALDLYLTSASVSPEAGVYVGRRKIDGDHHFLRVGVRLNPGGARVAVHFCRLAPHTPGHPGDDRRELAGVDVPAADVAGKYVPFRVSVESDSVTVHVAGHRLEAAVPPGGRMVTARGVEYHWTPTGGVGLVGKEAVITVRNMVLFDRTQPSRDSR